MLLILGINHKTAPVDIREKVAFGPDIVVAALRGLREQAGAEEAVILSTCNRTEIYASVNDSSIDALSEWICDFHSIEKTQLTPYLYAHTDKDCVTHLMRVASGLDSLVLGEPQILGQVKDAYQISVSTKSSGKMLDRLFQHSFSVAKQVRTDTAIGSSPVSVAFAAVNLAKQIFADLSEQTALLIGAGETIELAARHLHQQGIKHIIIANRTIEKAAALASEFEGYAIGLQDLPAHLAEADIVIASTASPLPILGKGMVESALKTRKHQPIFMVDIAVPRDIEAEVGKLEDIYLYTVDDLETVIEENKQSRMLAAEEAAEIIEQQTHNFMEWLKSLDAVSLIHSFRTQAESARDEVLERALKQIENGKTPHEALQFLAHTLTNRLLHTPSAKMREAGSNGHTELLDAADKLFAIGIDKKR
ncbi:glutamyl-tRNA reductase [Solemya elarraichensis gill symbiont]|uniref:Glutamyl-tRNA reductase n=1 Tax=Solemya elarraichensis gill symbiont TaxID=1918949 RepID=A0A1T2L6D4_9GAMM|nr:glutamyl-tRNA reductase [Solemya elarraichensis gill symbiont]OOZ40668.1 glutamyl-tRNA reductase [Solemya elarraichensis gill symbiont]